ncbi:unnamed protein product [Cuscuta epithymum]|uniref:Uncharacterized protein n=1 Tax=Cuscuta epithymum TaxID=186058 RepID=A0AAV0C2K9_9ASTE|nr:unnamed protein product [Cuscuta epithymum]
MVTETLCLPTAANGVSVHLNLMTTPSSLDLWMIPSQSEMNFGCRKSSPGSEVFGGADEGMDVLWEDFNDELHESSGSAGFHTDDVSEPRWSPDVTPPPANEKRAAAATEMRKRRKAVGGGGILSPFLMVKLLKKLLMFKKSSSVFKRHASLP